MAKSKDHKKTSVKPFMVKNHLSIFVNCMIENPAFDSQVRDLNFCINAACRYRQLRPRTCC